MITEFKLKKSSIIIDGYLDCSTVDDDEPELEYYNRSGQSNYYYPNNPFPSYTDEWVIYEGLKDNHLSDELFLDIIYENKDESGKLVHRSGYDILINP